MAKQHSPLECLSNIALFSDLPENLRKKLVTISTHQEYYPKGSLIRQPDDGKDGIIFLDKGSAKVYNLNEAGKETVLNVLNQGDSDGQSSLFKKEDNENFVQALDDTWICSMNRVDFQDLVRNTPDLALNLLNNFGEKLVTIERNSVRRNSLEAKDRILAYLQDLANKEGSNIVSLKLKKKDIASYLGVTPETFSRKLKELEKDGEIRVDKRQIEILN